MLPVIVCDARMLTTYSRSRRIRGAEAEEEGRGKVGFKVEFLVHT
jgi:hypothetical protein